MLMQTYHRRMMIIEFPTKPFILTAVFATMGAAPVAANTWSDATLLQREAVENEGCRGGPGNDNKTWEHCGARDILDEQLKDRGWCYGKPGQYGSQMEWHRCRAGGK
jgi:hypothetical protein